MKSEHSVMLEYLGDSPITRIIDFLLENRLFDYSKKQVAEGSGIGRVTLFKYWSRIEEIGIVKVSRKFGKTKLYKLNEESPIVKRIIDLELALADFAAYRVIEGQKSEKAMA